jgi:hypothetical protein
VLTCGSCNQAAFNPIAECGLPKCPGCGMVVCNDCSRDVETLREYGEWVISSDCDMGSLIFSRVWFGYISKLFGITLLGLRKLWKLTHMTLILGLGTVPH